MTLAELKELAMAATPGPWKARKSIHGSDYKYVQIDKHDNYTTLELLPPDAEHIAACSPERILAMIACIEAADAMRRWDHPDHPTDVDVSDAAYDRARAALEE